MIQKKEVIEQEYGLSGMFPQDVKYDYLSGWFLNFFAYYDKLDRRGNVKRFEGDSIKVKDFKKLANQMLVVPFTIVDLVHKKEYLMKYNIIL